MQLEHRFVVPLSPQETWDTLLDLELVATCFPGAQLEQIQGDTFEGRVKVKLGPISMTYRGQGRFVERDDDRRRIVIDANGRDGRGSSTAAARVAAAVSEHADGAEVTVTTDLDITGPPAQLGGGAVEDVSQRLLDQFVERLRTQVTGGAPTAVPEGPDRTAVAEPSAGGRARPATVPSDGDQLDLVATVLGPDAGKLVVVGLAGLFVGFVLGRLGNRRPVQIVLPPEALGR